MGIKNLVFLTSLVFLLLSIGTVEADTCGGVTACHCGDTLTSSHTMTYDLINCAGHGIVIGANGIILDCQGHTIDGDGTVNMKYGIYSDGKNNNIIKNCVATDFSNSSSCGIYLSSSNNNVLINNTANSNYYGIVLYYSSNSTLTNNTANSKHYGIYLSAYSNNNMLTDNTANGNIDYGIVLASSSNNNLIKNIANSNHYGIYLSSSSNSTLTNNIANSNDYGIYLSSSSNNTVQINSISNNTVGIGSQSSNSSINTNYVCGNINQDFSSPNWFSSSGDNNTCDKPDGWNDYQATGCSYPCSQPSCYSKNAGICTVNIGENCTCINQASNDTGCNEVRLQSNITNWVGTCVNNPTNFTNKTFNCQGHTIDGDGSGADNGIYLNGKAGNTIRNCVVTNFSTGITLSSSSNNNTLINNTANSNSNHGIVLDSSSNNNILTGNIANSNSNGIVLDTSCSNNILTNNTANENQQVGLYFDGSSHFNTVNSNRFCSNNQSGWGYDIYDGDSNSGDNNTFCTASNYFDISESTAHPYTFGCPGICEDRCYVWNTGVCTVRTGENCTCINQALNDNVRCNIEVRLNSSIFNWVGTCVNNPANFTNKIFNCQGHMIDGAPGTSVIYLYNKNGNTIKNCNVSDFYYGIDIRFSSGIKLYNNTVTNGMFGIYFVYSSNGNISGNILYGNYIGMDMQGSLNNNLFGNTMNNNNFNGIYLEISSNNNTLTNNTANSNSNHGIVLDSSLNNTLTNNTANLNNGNGIFLSWNSNFNNISKNKILNNTQNGIKLENVQNASITYNTIANNSVYGIKLTNSTKTLIDKNEIDGNTLGGIYFDPSDSNTVTDNTVARGEIGIKITDASYNRIQGNRIINNSLGISLTNSIYNLIFNNLFENTNNAQDDGSNFWNTTLQAGINIVGGTYIGGNYWSDYTGKDNDGNGIGDTDFPYNSHGNIAIGGDYLPLVKVPVCTCTAWVSVNTMECCKYPTPYPAVPIYERTCTPASCDVEQRCKRVRACAI